VTRARVVAFVGACVLLAAACHSSSSNAKSATTGSTAASTAARPSHAVDEGARTRATSANGGLVLETASTRAELVSGDDVLLTLSGTAAASAVVMLNGEQVTDVFSANGADRRGLVTGLRRGSNTITAETGNDRVTLEVVNHSKAGPLFSGPHLEPWVCTTIASGLGPPTDGDCDAPTRTTWSYRAKNGTVKPLADPASRPPDLSTTKLAGRDVPVIVRTEQGVIDRGIYTIWTLDPSPGAGGDWDRSGWNERLVFRFGGGCGTQYSQGSSFAGDADLDLLGRGYAVATNTLDTFQTACNPTLSAEAALMTREHFIEAYGVPRFTIGDGGSGGAIQQLAIAYNYPGILDAISAAVPFPDAVSIAGGVTDCGLLVHYYTTDFGASLTDAQKEAINGHASTGTCEMWNQLFVGGVNPTDGCDAIGDRAYDPTKNRTGARCTLQDSNVNVFGVDPATGFARRPLDNVGIQYGLDALAKGVITVDQFLDLNEHIGGYDIDGNIVATREHMDADTAAVAYRTGAVVEAGPLSDVPIILRNLYTDAAGDIHTRFHSFSIRERLQHDGNDDPNLLLWTAPVGDLVASLLGNVAGANEPILLLDDWLTSGKKPDDATNRCVLPDGTVLRGGWELYDAPGPCMDAYPIHGDPRIAAGEAQRGDVIKCALAPIDMTKYSVAFTDAQQARLRQLFPDGVCDWTAPGVGVAPSAGPWQDYSH
jgi:Tannase-like family of unknown function (DUF6351)